MHPILPPIGFTGVNYTGAYAGTNAYANIKRPITAATWQEVCGIAPDFLWLFQEASGNLAATIGASATLTKNSTGQNYSQTVTDWTTTWCGTDLNSGHGWVNSNDIFNCDGQSLFMVGYQCVTAASGSVMQMYSLDAGNRLGMRTRSASGQLQINRNATTTSCNTAYGNATPTPFPMTVIWNRSTSQLRFNSDSEQVTGSYGSVGTSVTTMGLGQTGSDQNAAGARYNLWAVWLGTNAETMSARGGAGNGGRTLIGDLGWSLSY